MSSCALLTVVHRLQSMFGMHNKDRFEVFCFSLTASDGSTYRKKIASEVCHMWSLSFIRMDQALVINRYREHC